MRTSSRTPPEGRARFPRFRSIARPSRSWSGAACCECRPRLVILAVAVVLCLIYVAKLILVVLLVSVLLSFVLAPVVDFLVVQQVPRAVASFIAVFAAGLRRARRHLCVLQPGNRFRPRIATSTDRTSGKLSRKSANRRKSWKKRPKRGSVRHQPASGARSLSSRRTAGRTC